MTPMTTSDAADEARIRELHRGETVLGFTAMKELRTGLESAEDFVARVDDVQRAEGYRLVGVFVPGETDAVAVAGFRLVNNLVDGRFLYVDDLVTASAHRRAGHAARLLEWLRDEAVTQRCERLQLDSATFRHAAHKLYLASGMDITAFHFDLELAEPDAD
jgi:GNAT superfamily N-acetyltransferase